jgi:hypothetical protein
MYYTRDEEAGKNITLSLRELCLKEEFDLESVFHAVRDAVDSQDLLDRFRRIMCDPVRFETETDKYIRFEVLDVHGNINYLKFKIKRG